MTFDLLNLVVPTAVTSAVQLAIWAAVQRSIERRDKKLADMEQQIAEMRDTRIANVESALEQRMPRELCARIHAQLDKRLEEGNGEFHDHGTDISLLKISNARMEANLKLIMQSMHLTWTEHPK